MSGVVSTKGRWGVTREVQMVHAEMEGIEGMEGMEV